MTTSSTVQEALLSPVTYHLLPRITARRTRAWDVLSIPICLAIFIIYYTGVVASDDLMYLQALSTVPAGQRPNPGWWYIYVRFVQWGPLLAITKLLPAQPWAMGVASLLATMGTLLVIRRIAREVLGLRPAIIAACLVGYSLIPPVTAAASVAVPDPVATLLAWLGVWLAARSLLRADAGRALLHCALAGFIIGLGYNAKETVAAFVGGLLLFTALRRRREPWAWRRAAALVGGAVTYLVIETLVLWWLAGDPLAHPKGVAISHRAFEGPTLQPGLGGLLIYWSEYIRWMIDPRSEFGLLGPVLLAGLGWAALRGGDPGRLLACVVAPAFAFLCVGSTDWAHYNPVIHQPRYLIPLLPAMVLGTGLCVEGLAARGPRAASVAGVAVAALLLLALPGPNRLAGRWYQARAFRAGCEVLTKVPPEARVLAGGLSRNRFSCVREWLPVPRVEAVLNPPSSPEEWLTRYPGAYVVTSRFDRRGAGTAKQKHLSLHGAALDSLGGFPLVARAEPPRDRLSTIWSRLTGQPVPTEPDEAVEIRLLKYPCHSDSHPAEGSR